MGYKVSNNLLTTLASSILAGSQTLTVAAGAGASAPAVVGGTPSYLILTLEDDSGNREQVRVDVHAAGTDVFGSVTYPLQRGYNSTTARAWTAGDSVDIRVVAEEYQKIIDKVDAGGAGWGFGPRPSAFSGLAYAYYGGPILGGSAPTTIADGTVTLTGSATNYVERDDAGAVTANTSAFSTGKTPMARVTTNATDITAVVDCRIVLNRGSARVMGCASFCNAATPTTKWDMVARQVSARDPITGTTITFTPSSRTVDTGTAGPAAGGRDQAGAFGANSWLYFYWIAKADGTYHGIVSTTADSAGGPVLPSGYTHWALDSIVRFNGSSNLLRTFMAGAWAHYLSPEADAVVVSGGTATAETAASTSATVPPTALSYSVGMEVTNGDAAAYASAKVRALSGSDLGHTIADPNPAGGSSYGTRSILVPNTGNLYYLFNTSASGRALTMVVESYKVRNGGE